MNEMELEQLKRKELLDLARKESIKNPARYRKADLIELIVRHQQSGESYRRKKSQKIESLKESSKKRSDKAELTPPQPIYESAPPAGYQTPQPQEMFSLPYSYNVTKIVLMVRDPYWAFVYWDIDEGKYNEIQGILQKHSGQARVILRVYDVTNIRFNGSNAHRTFDLDVNLNAKSWYVHFGIADRDYMVDLGVLDPQGKFHLIARSNVMRSPRDTASDVIDENWMVCDFDEMYALSGGLGIGLSSGEIRKRKKFLFEQLVSSGSVASSPGLFMKQPVARETDFFLEVGTELILYGRTKPDAHVTLAGKPVSLRPDGTFSVRFHLPDGSLHLPVIAVSSDKEHTRQITTNVNKNTH